MQVLLLDEITVDMDVLGRLDLLNFLKEESERRNATILYATHIFDGLEPWITHVAHVADGKLVRGETSGTSTLPLLRANFRFPLPRHYASLWKYHQRAGCEHAQVMENLMV